MRGAVSVPLSTGLAYEHYLKGWVRNTSGNVLIAVEGTLDNIGRSVADLDPPIFIVLLGTLCYPCCPTSF